MAYPQDMRIIRQFMIGGLLVCILGFFSACAYLNISNQITLARDSTILSGMVTFDGKDKGPVVVVAYSRVMGMVKLAHYVVLDKPGSYELLVGSGDYFLAAFIDHNRNLRFDNDEYAAGYGHLDRVSVRDAGILTDLDIAIPDNNRLRVDFPIGYRLKDRRPDPFHSSLAGTIFSMDDTLYSLKTAEKGYWAPVDFFRSFGGNIYFLEPYDPMKIPVLFIHGATGSPVNFRTMAKLLDHERYQAWFYYYPSGAGLTAMSNLLSKKIEDLERMYGFTQLHIIAHSMGGLVSRNFLVNFGGQYPYIKSYITICTPWGGVEAAEKGVATSPFVLSSWRDIARGSQFIDELYKNNLSQVPFYLFFGFRGDRVPWKANNDGTITLQSQLDPRAQAEAVGSFGFNETHTSILENPVVAEQIQALINKNSVINGSRPGSSLVLDLIGINPENPPVPFLAHISHVADPHNSNAEIREETFLLSPTKIGKQEMTVPIGTYQLGIMAWGYKAQPSRVSIELKPNSSLAVNIVLRPITLLSVRILSHASNERPTVGLLQTNSEKLAFSSVLLDGQGIHRELKPIGSDRRGFSDRYLDYQDFYADGRLVFFDLEPGAYRLTVMNGVREVQTIQCEVLRDHVAPDYSVVIAGAAK